MTDCCPFCIAATASGGGGGLRLFRYSVRVISWNRGNLRLSLPREYRPRRVSGSADSCL